MSKIRTRFSPSPTGNLHLGSIRTALYSWLFSKKEGGHFILRIEDTDYIRSTQKNIDVIIDGMTWLNLDWDEGPYFQSERLNLYNSIAEEMLVKGTAYRCFCSKERIESLRQSQILNKKKPRYDGYCRNNRILHFTKNPYVIRFCNPKEGIVSFNDRIKGIIKFNNEELDDLIIFRSDGSPTYNFCVVVDDADMKITHVIRGDDHINNTPRQINIFRALNYPIPEYAHIPMIIGNNKKKNYLKDIMQLD